MGVTVNIPYEAFLANLFLYGLAIGLIVGLVIGVVGSIFACRLYYRRFDVQYLKHKDEQEKEHQKADRMKAIEDSMEFIANPGYFRSKSTPYKFYCATCWNNKSKQVELSQRIITQAGKPLYTYSSCDKDK